MTPHVDARRSSESPSAPNSSATSATRGTTTWPSLSSTPRWRARWSTRLLRRAGFYWAVALALAALTAGTAHQLTQRAIGLKASLGQARTVAVTKDAVAQGELLAGHVEWREVPVAFLPADPVAVLAIDARSSRHIGTGVVLTAPDVSSGTTLDQDQAAVTVPTGPATPVVSVGQRVLVVVHPDPFAGLDGDQVTAVVHEVSDDRLALAVPRNQIAKVAAALNGAGVTIAVL